MAGHHVSSGRRCGRYVLVLIWLLPHHGLQLLSSRRQVERDITILLHHGNLSADMHAPMLGLRHKMCTTEEVRHAQCISACKPVLAELLDKGFPDADYMTVSPPSVVIIQLCWVNKLCL